MTKNWDVALTLTEDEGRTKATAHLHGIGAGQLGAGRGGTTDTELCTEGLARCHPRDVDVPTIGDEVAASRALFEMANKLLDIAARNIESHAGERRTPAGV